MDSKIKEAASLIKNAKHAIAFTGAGISVESGVPPFRGEKGIWNKFDPDTVEINYFYQNPKESWRVVKEIFFKYLEETAPNAAHFVLAKLEEMGFIKSVITQNVDGFHEEAGSKVVYEFHGNTKKLVCTECGQHCDIYPEALETLPPLCGACRGVLKPDFIFFGEPIPPDVSEAAFNEAKAADVVLVIGTTGEVMPSSMIPATAKEQGAKIVEINVETSNFTHEITDIFLQGKATEIMGALFEEIRRK